MASTAKTQKISANPIREIAEWGPLFLDKPLSRAEFIALSARYPELRMEREASGKITIMSPVKGGSGNRESIAIFFLTLWWYQKKQGKTYSSSTGFEMPDGAVKSPDAAWVSPARLKDIGPEAQEKGFLKAVPDFVIEILSDTDSLPRLQQKMLDTWMAHGVRLAWLIDPYEERAYLYRADGSAEVVEGFEGKTLQGEDVMPGMELPLEELRITA